MKKIMNKEGKTAVRGFEEKLIATINRSTPSRPSLLLFLFRGSGRGGGPEEEAGALQTGAGGADSRPAEEEEEVGKKL